MDKKTEALKLALGALEVATTPLAKDRQEVLRARAAIREALAAVPEAHKQQSTKCVEPVAVVSGYYNGQCVILPIDPARIFNSNTTLYTSPPASKPWMGLTNQELIDLTAIYSGAPLYCAIEAKLREKNA